MKRMFALIFLLTACETQMPACQYDCSFSGSATGGERNTGATQ